MRTSGIPFAAKITISISMAKTCLFACLEDQIKLTCFLGVGVIQDRKLRSENSGVVLGYASLDSHRMTIETKGLEVQYLVLSIEPPGNLNACRLLLVKQRDGQRLEFERVGCVVSANLDVRLDEPWFAANCISTTLSLL